MGGDQGSDGRSHFPIEFLFGEKFEMKDLSQRAGASGQQAAGGEVCQKSLVKSHKNSSDSFASLACKL